MKFIGILPAAVSAAVCVLLSTITAAQVEVVESNNRLLDSPQSISAEQSAVTPGGSGNQVELFYQVQMLQQELSELRGLLEEQAHELKRLKQQRLDDYVSLDRRLSGLSGGKVSAEPSDAGAVSSAATQTTAQAPDEMQRYRTAIDLVLRKKDYAQAVVAFSQYLNDFPQGRYAANSQYWLGEIFLLQGDLEQAREWFARLLADHADHSKAPDATYKLGTVYHKLGDKEKAKALLEQVASGSTNAARLASSYLSDNF